MEDTIILAGNYLMLIMMTVMVVVCAVMAHSLWGLGERVQAMIIASLAMPFVFLAYAWLNWVGYNVGL